MELVINYINDRCSAQPQQLSGAITNKLHSCKLYLPQTLL